MSEAKAVDTKLIVDRFTEGRSPWQLSKEHGIPPSQVMDIVRGYQVERLPRGEISLSDPYHLFGGIGNFERWNPSILVQRRGLMIFDRMRRDDQVKAAMTLKKHAVISPGWTLTNPADAPEDWEPTRFIEREFARMPGNFSQKLLDILTALDYGYSITEKIFGLVPSGEEFAGKLGLDDLKTRKPHTFTFRQDEFGNILGVVQDQNLKGRVDMPIEKFCIFQHQAEFGNPYGVSDLEAAYRPWWTKDNAYKWVAMLLERFGIPPMFALYDPNAYAPEQVSRLETVLKNLQANTTGVIPRANKENFEFWSPTAVGEAAPKVFLPALAMFNQDIARAILMPGLLGMTPDENKGSMARSQVHFDVFVKVVEWLASTLAETVVQEQIIKPLIDVNYGPGEYPVFSFNEMSDEVRTDLIEQWEKQVAVGTVRPTEQDEDHIREQLRFPEFSGDEMPKPEPEVVEVEVEPENDQPDEGDENQEDEEGDEGDERRNSIARTMAATKRSRRPNAKEKHINFQQVTADLTALDANGKSNLAASMGVTRDLFIKRFDRQWKDSAASAQKVTRNLPKFQDFSDAVQALLDDSFRGGRAAMRDELKAAKATSDNAEMFQIPNVIPADAMKHLETKKFWITGVLNDRLLGESRQVLLRAIETGELAGETRTKLLAVFEPYVGDGKAVLPEVVEAARLETIVRTNVTDAYNSGRLVQARRAGDLVGGFVYSAILDDRTTDVCAFMDGKIFRADDPSVDRLKPPRHFNCRSILVAQLVGEPVASGDLMTASKIGKAVDLSGKGFK